MANKYGARKTIINGIRFASQGEARRYQDLLLMERAGIIANLRTQPRFVLQEKFTDAQGTRHQAITYIADFEYIENGRHVVEDFKGAETEVFRIKRKLLLKSFVDQGLNIEFRVTKAR